MGKKRKSGQRDKGQGGSKAKRGKKPEKQHHHVKMKKKKHTWKSVREKQRGRSEGDNETMGSIGEEERDDHVTVTTHQPSTSVSRKQGGSSSSSLRKRMTDRLSVARFRSLNAAMDAQPPPKLSSSSPSKAGNPLSQKETFASYHAGFNAACSLWKQNPLDVIASWIVKSVPEDHVIADFGCGSGKLAKSVPHTTHSFDLHALEEHVVACDMRDVPLSDKSVHVVVFCLSLMGNDVTEFIAEARRVLVNGGLIKIAEAAARLSSNESMRGFVGGMKQLGFQKVGAVEQIGGKDSVFVVMEFKKLGGDFTRSGKKKRVIMLTPCVYKKR